MTSLKQAWVQHLLALMIATLLSCSLVCTWALQVHSLSADRADASFIIWGEPAFRQREQSVFPFDVTSLLRQTWEERA